MPRLHRWSIAAVALTAVGALGLAGCGSSSSSSTTTTAGNGGSANSTQTTTSGTSTTGASNTGTIAAVQDPSPAGAWGKQPTVVVPSGSPPAQLESSDLIVGSGPAAKAGDNVTVQYVLATYSSGKVVQSSWTSQPFTFVLGEGQVIPGWDKGVVGMKAGGRRELVIPPSLGYGAQSPGSGIAANDTLVFVVDLQKIG
ncbi:MAG: FKBP-type peptidyl-prolyl cis-trans isomerase [Acidimicrobiales bacterium]